MSHQLLPTQYTLTYYGHAFEFEYVSQSETALRLRLLFDQASEDRYEQLREAEAEQEAWYLDQKGQRKSPDALFEASPWCLQRGEQYTKLLHRQTYPFDEFLFQLPQGYHGEWFDWMNQISG